MGFNGAPRDRFASGIPEGSIQKGPLSQAQLACERAVEIPVSMETADGGAIGLHAEIKTSVNKICEVRTEAVLAQQVGLRLWRGTGVRRINAGLQAKPAENATAQDTYKEHGGQTKTGGPPRDEKIVSRTCRKSADLQVIVEKYDHVFSSVSAICTNLATALQSAPPHLHPFCLLSHCQQLGLLPNPHSLYRQWWVNHVRGTVCLRWTGLIICQIHWKGEPTVPVPETRGFQNLPPSNP